MHGRSVLNAALVAAGLAAARRAHADAPLGPPITDRNYAIELYDNSALGNDATVAMGGAAVANAIGSSGTLVNPSAPAVRPTTDNDRWSWDYHLGYLNSSLSTDYDNNGRINPGGSGTAVLTGGLSLRAGDWALAATATVQSLQIADAMPLTADTQRAKVAIAHWVPAWDLALGGAIQLAQFDLKPDCTGSGTGSGCASLFSINGAGLEAGATWIPRAQRFRLGGEAATPIAGANVVASTCADPAACEGYILPLNIVSAWRVAAGGAYRWAPTPWNQQVKAPWRDERALTAVADLVVVGSAANAYGLEGFGQHERQRSGVHASYSLRGGVEYEWLPGRLRVRGGSYWEPGRYADVSGRLHGTFGLEVRAFQFDFWGPRRGQLTLTGDVAARYRNVGLAVGFWH